MKRSRYQVQFRRRRECRTDYNSRFALLKSGRTRLVIRRSSGNMLVQFVNFNEKGDVIVASAATQTLKKHGWGAPTGNIPASYLAGLAAGVHAKKKGVTDAILDNGVQTSTKGSRIYAALKGVIDAGIKVPHSADVLPSNDRISGKHIAEWAGKAGGFTKYKVAPAEMQKHFEQVKEKIMHGV